MSILVLSLDIKYFNGYGGVGTRPAVVWENDIDVTSSLNCRGLCRAQV